MGLKKIAGQLIKRNADGSDISFGKGDYVIQALIVLSMITFAVGTLPNLSPFTQQLLTYFEIITVAIFTIELMMRLLLTKPRGRYLFTFLGVVDLLSILPFYLALGIDMRSVRIFRLLRLLRILKLARYNRAVYYLLRSFLGVKEELIIFGAVTLILLYLTSVGIYYFEHDAQPDKYASVFHSFWWAIVTLTTVGYGDVYPITAGGKVFTTLILIIGLGLVAIPTGLIASSLTDIKEKIRNNE